MVQSTSLQVVPDDPTAYKTKEYWEARYKQENPDVTFDWFKTYEELRPLLNKMIPDKQSSILILGCGNSTLGEDMYNDGYKNITNIDYSATVIENMKQRCSHQPEMKWMEMDIRDLRFEDESFDVVIDKGTMDALMCDRGDVWDPSEDLIADVKGEVDEVQRVLKVGGVFLYITFGQPHFRKRHLNKPLIAITLRITEHNEEIYISVIETPFSPKAVPVKSPEPPTPLYSFARRYSTPVNSVAKSPDQQLQQLHELGTALNKTTSILERHAVLLEYPCCHSILRRIYDPHLRHHITSKRMLAYLEQQKINTTPANSLIELLDALSSRQITGNAALDAAAAFYINHCKTDIQRLMFCRVLDRNLKVGVSVRTVCKILKHVDEPKTSETDNSFFHVSLANTLHPGCEHKLWDSKSYDHGDWYASRKLDGVRCIAFVKQGDIRFYSRTGRMIKSLQKVEEAIRTRLTEKQQNFVLDGEICIYDNGSTENFLAVNRQIRMKDRPMTNPVYEVFDYISIDGFMAGKDPTTFAERQRQLAAFIQKPQPHLRAVEQTKVTSATELLHMKEQAILNGWEGLIVRNNVFYKGKRSRDMLKIKEWEDAEYLVKDIETGLMRMPDTGEDKRVMTSVLIEHKGNAVSVGSGFTLPQRIQYAEVPDRIIGKPITVRYFSESITENGARSLRFPSVKAIYEEGKRDI
ncbi:hypothetical protein EC973_001853 [Apophysomyces ossiformis]|uniref:ATP-dependent DNA ligase family profile domain-containing protein n=1 Tax=Apophysomyces ossiformis TaxID=679940 RepID=A0A8H7EMX0_9FUNG|nr:hypothetical protein EC973_001853 [Apophysomyces ossiformis]